MRTLDEVQKDIDYMISKKDEKNAHKAFVDSRYGCKCITCGKDLFNEDPNKIQMFSASDGLNHEIFIFCEECIKNKKAEEFQSLNEVCYSNNAKELSVDGRLEIKSVRVLSDLFIEREKLKNGV